MFHTISADADENVTVSTISTAKKKIIRKISKARQYYTVQLYSVPSRAHSGAKRRTLPQTAVVDDE